MRSLLCLCLLWSLHCDLGNIPYIIKYHFFLKKLNHYYSKLVWMLLSVIMVMFWEHSSMENETIFVLTIGIRLWCELMIGCKHKTFLLIAFSLLISILLYAISSISYWGDAIPVLIILSATIQSYRVLTSDPKDFHQKQPTCQRRFKLY